MYGEAYRRQRHVSVVPQVVGEVAQFFFEHAGELLHVVPGFLVTLCVTPGLVEVSYKLFFRQCVHRLVLLFCHGTYALQGKDSTRRREGGLERDGEDGADREAVSAVVAVDVPATRSEVQSPRVLRCALVEGAGPLVAVGACVVAGPAVAVACSREEQRRRRKRATGGSWDVLR